MDSAGSDVDYLSDSRGVQVTPIARPAPSNYNWQPPKGFKANRLFNQVHNISPGSAAAKKRQTIGYKNAFEQAKKLGAGMAAFTSFAETDDGLGVDASVCRIVNI